MPRLEKQRGFTLIEVVTVVLVMGVVALVAQPAVNSSLDHAKLSAAADEVVAAFRYARATAAATGAPCRVTLDASADVMVVEQFRSSVDFTDPGLTEISRSAAESMSFVSMERPMQRGKAYSLDFQHGRGYGGVDIVSVSLGPGSSVTFDRFGMPSSGGTVTLARGVRRVVISIDGLSGRATVSGL